MNSQERKKVTIVTKYASQTFTESDWYTLGQLTGKLKVVNEHPRLFRSMSFGDDDYDLCVAEVLDTIFSDSPNFIDEIIDHFDIDLWYQQKDPQKYERIFLTSIVKKADFWGEGHLKLFISHLSKNKERMSAMKSGLSKWGISAFVAHEDIEPTRKWMDEVEAGLETMEAMVAVVEPGFKESDWCAQEIGFALGRKIDIIPLRAGMDPFGFFGKIQGVQIKGKYPEEVCDEITKLLLKKPKHRNQLLQSIPKAFSQLSPSEKIKRINLLDEWSLITDEQLKSLIELSALSSYEKPKLKNLIARVGAFEKAKVESPESIAEDAPF
jgi:hypothetical protein